MSDKIIPFEPERRRGIESGPDTTTAHRRPPVPRVPDFARADVTWLTPRDITFLLEATGQTPDANGWITEGITPALETLLDHESVHEKVAGDASGWLDISAHLYFHVMLRRLLPAPTHYLQRRVLRYLGNLLSLFVRTDRLYRVQPGEDESFEYLVDLLTEAAASEHERRFLVHAHLGNYSLYLAGLGRNWIEYRRKYGRSALGVDYYHDMGRRAYHQAAGHRLARELELAPVFTYLSQQFDRYAGALRRLGTTRPAPAV